MKYLNVSEQREMLEEEAEQYLINLYNSNPVGRDETPSVYLSQGKLQGMCRIFNAVFTVDLRRKITFYKYNKYLDEKFWFQVENEYVTEEEAARMIDQMGRENRELSELRARI
ncbi:hypothetical protein [Bacillus pumilus]|uniref:hypothetical protein n=1 Tax=Bacillus pumilus TaxID=1408 RepID=UPI0011E8EAA9|nr:hypothetical protein [Bacillus pumilus]TYS40525.1 hypothetical protein FZC68_17110 [Bacillus pumilus]